MCRSGEAKEIRASAGVSLQEVGSDVGVSFSAIWRWERGDRLPRGPEAIEYGRVLDELLTVLGRRRGGRSSG
jgi:transcriptional regulator with XRE-family HTH domain